MKTLLKQFGLLIAMIIVFCGTVSAQYEISFLNDSGVWVVNAWNHNSSANYKHPSISAIGGDTIYARLVDVASGNVNDIDFWLIDDMSGDVDTVLNDTLSYILPSTMYAKYIRAYKNELQVTNVLILPKFLAPPLILDVNDTIFKSLESSITLTLSDFDIVVNTSSGGCNSSRCDSIYWYRDNVLINSGTDTSYVAMESGEYSIKAKLIYMTYISLISPDTCKFIDFKSSNTITITINTTSVTDKNIDSDMFNIYPNPTSDFLNISEKGECIIYSISGKEEFRGVTNRIDVSNFIPGTYILKTHRGDFKFLVN